MTVQSVLVAPDAPAPAAASAAVSAQEVRPQPPSATIAGDNWPRTTRVLPWMIAAFMAMLWLMPFNSISMTVTLPFELHLDRIVLPVIVLVWVLVLAAHGPNAPRIRHTPIHGAIALYVALAFLSVLVNVQQINQLLAFNDAVKHLVLLASYGMLFVIVASVVRRTELHAFLTYTLVLVVLCALGTIWQARFHYNVFYDWSAKLLPGVFKVPQVTGLGLDELGRATTFGPAENGLEVAAMLAMGLPVALVRLMHADRWRNRIIYALAASLIVAAGLSTYRKTSLIAPVVVILTLACFRRKELLRMAPLALVLVVAVHLFSPGSLGAVVSEFTGKDLTSVGTTAHRVGAYDAIRPLVWTHPMLGQGYGTYNAFVERVLDSQILSSSIETGLLGLGAYLLMIISVVVSVRSLIRSRDPTRAPPALMAAAAAMAFLTVSFLFDAMGFPHGPYIFLVFAAFAAVLLGSSEDVGRSSAGTSEHAGGWRQRMIVRFRPGPVAERIESRRK